MAEYEKLTLMKFPNDRRSPALMPGFEMCGITYPDRNYHVRRKASNTVSCIEFVRAGRGEVTVGGTRFSVARGDSYFLPSGLDQDYFSDPDDPMEKIWVNLRGSFCPELARLYGVDRIFLFRGLDLSELILGIHYYAEHPNDPSASEQCEALLIKIFHRMAEHSANSAETELSPLQKIFAFLRLHESEALRIEQVAQACGKSPSQTERIFRKETGVSLYRFMLGRRIELAKQYLSETGLPIREIAERLSFEDEFYFSGLFREKTGFSPSDYRKKTRGRNRVPADGNDALAISPIPNAPPSSVYFHSLPQLPSGEEILSSSEYLENE